MKNVNIMNNDQYEIEISKSINNLGTKMVIAFETLIGIIDGTMKEGDSMYLSHINGFELAKSISSEQLINTFKNRQDVNSHETLTSWFNEYSMTVNCIWDKSILENLVSIDPSMSADQHIYARSKSDNPFVFIDNELFIRVVQEAWNNTIGINQASHTYESCSVQVDMDISNQNLEKVNDEKKPYGYMIKIARECAEKGMRAKEIMKSTGCSRATASKAYSEYKKLNPKSTTSIDPVRTTKLSMINPYIYSFDVSSKQIRDECNCSPSYIDNQRSVAVKALKIAINDPEIDIDGIVKTVATISSVPCTKFVAENAKKLASMYHTSLDLLSNGCSIDRVVEQLKCPMYYQWIIKMAVAYNMMTDLGYIDKNFDLNERATGIAEDLYTNP